MSHFGIGNCLISLLESFLKRRTQIVVVNGAKSDEIHPTSSVPQGFTLSALLFAMFINDLATKMKCGILLFADDVKIYLKIDCFRDCVKLQKDIYELHKWCNENKLFLNIAKCNVVSYSRKSEDNIISFIYRINNVALNRTNRMKDLGVIFYNKLTFQHHISSIVSRAYRMIGFISRSLTKFKKIETYRRLYFCYVRCILEYATPIWNPYYNVYIDKIEKVQRKFTRIVAYKFNIPRETYSNRLQRMNIISLKSRRIILDQLLFYKILNGLLNTSLKQAFNTNRHIHNTRFAPTFYWGRTSTNIDHFSVKVRLQRQHNELFSHSNIFNHSLNRFKAYIIDNLPAETWN